MQHLERLLGVASVAALASCRTVADRFDATQTGPDPNTR